MDGVKDVILPHVYGERTTKEMWEALNKLYKSDNNTRELMLREKLNSVKQGKGEGIGSYLTKFTHLKDELAAVGEKMDPDDLVKMALRGLGTRYLSVVLLQGKLCLSGSDYGVIFCKKS